MVKVGKMQNFREMLVISFINIQDKLLPEL